jgi:hypothetical protein
MENYKYKSRDLSITFKLLAGLFRLLVGMPSSPENRWTYLVAVFTSSQLKLPGLPGEGMTRDITSEAQRTVYWIIDYDVSNMDTFNVFGPWDPGWIGAAG